MSDRSAFTLVVYDCPPEQREAVLGIINEHGLTEDYFGDKDVDELDLGATYGYGEMDLTAYQDVAEEIIEAAPGATFQCWNDPKYEYGGATTIYAPDLGRFTGDCDSDGDPYITASRFREVMKGGSAFADQQDRALGLPWLDRLDDLKAKVPA